ncbi:hypothetical protein L3081_15680 [Colwellia sp. MSW7]|jgi:hypothetical protein|uniref:Lipoprotein n=1 Tax=Colwellia maritima TaxID=2912588 RepID=A0ABS9X6B3_9GAMM|nr:hypothetical protein [Colwellia maritima]MCI2284567.1 hypothetical protein [Colwellia maritima]
MLKLQMMTHLFNPLMLKKLPIIFVFLFFLSACSGEEEINEIENPKFVAVAFFEAIYNEKDIDKAASICSPKLARLLIHYKTPQSVARHLFNMSFEKTIDIRPDDSGVKIRERFKDKIAVTIYIEGYYNESKVKHVKRLLLIQNDDDQWIIDEILKDPF